MKLWSWLPSKVPGAVPLALSGPNADTSPEAEALSVIAQLQSRPLADRGLMLFYPSGYVLTDHTSQNEMATFLTRGAGLDGARVQFDGYIRLASLWPDKPANLCSAREWYDRYWRTFWQAGCDISTVVLDDESGVTNWSFGWAKTDPDYWRGVWNDPQVRAAMPAACQQYSADDVWNLNHDAVVAFNDWTNQLKDAAARELICGTYAKYFGVAPRVSNWQNIDPQVSMLDPNGWTLSRSRVAKVSSPEIYIGWWDWRATDWKNFTPQNDPFWRRFIRIQNGLRSLVASTDESESINLWIPFPRWTDYAPASYPAPLPIQYLQLQAIKHAMQLGIGEFTYWNPAGAGKAPTLGGTTAQDDADLANVLKGPVRATRLNLPQIDEDATTIVTGSAQLNWSYYHSLWKKVA